MLLDMKYYPERSRKQKLHIIFDILYLTLIFYADASKPVVDGF